MDHLTLAKCSLAAYQNEDAFRRLGYHIIIPFGIEEVEPIAYLAIDNIKQEMVLSFRGTEHWSDIISNIRFMRVSSIGGTHIHRGFLQRWKKVRHNINIAIRDHKEKALYVTGHSLGGAIAAIYLLQGTKLAGEVVTFGAPRIGGQKVADELTRRGLVRYVNTFDIVPKIPRVGYVHGGEERVLDQSRDHLTWYERLWKWIKRPKDILKPHSIKSYIRRIQRGA